MRTRTLLPSLGVALCLCAVLQPAAAQSPRTPPTGAPSATPSAASDTLTRWDARPVGKYDIELTLPDRVMQVDLTIADSAGHLTAMFWPVGDRDGHEMSVTVRDTDLLLHADAPRGAVDIVLQRRKERITGRWTMGEEHGAVQGRVSNS